MPYGCVAGSQNSLVLGWGDHVEALLHHLQELDFGDGLSLQQHQLEEVAPHEREQGFDGVEY